MAKEVIMELILTLLIFMVACGVALHVAKRNDNEK